MFIAVTVEDNESNERQTLINTDHIVSVTMRDSTEIYLSTGYSIFVKEDFSDIRRWLEPHVKT